MLSLPSIIEEKSFECEKPITENEFQKGIIQFANKPASSLVVSLGKALNGTLPPLCGRQVAQFSHRIERWWQEGHPTVKQMTCNKNADICCGDP